MASQRCWLIKSEPDVYSIDDLKRDGRTCWDGVRNYQARNFIRDDMRIGDRVLFYHSSTDAVGVAGIARVCKAAYADHTALDPNSDHYDPKSTAEHPIWMMVDLEFVEKFDRVVTLATLRATTGLESMLVLQRGQRLSVQPVDEKHFKRIESLGRSK